MFWHSKHRIGSQNVCSCNSETVFEHDAIERNSKVLEKQTKISWKANEKFESSKVHQEQMECGISVHGPNSISTSIWSCCRVACVQNWRLIAMENRLKFITLCNLLGKAFKLLKSPHKLLNSSENDFGKFDAFLMQLVEILIRVGFGVFPLFMAWCIKYFHCAVERLFNIMECLISHKSLGFKLFSLSKSPQF